MAYFRSAIKLTLVISLLTVVSGCEFFSALFRGIAALGDAPKVALLEDSGTRIFGDIATPGAKIQIAAISNDDRGVMLQTYDNFTSEGYIDYLIQSPSDDHLFVQHVETFLESGVVAEEYGPQIFNNISGRREYFATDNTESEAVERLCIPGSSLLAEGRSEYDVELHGTGEPIVLIDDHISNVYRGLGWLDANRLLMLSDIELQLRLGTPEGEIYDVFRSPNRRGVFYLVLVRNDAGTWTLMSCGEDEVALPSFSQSRNITLSSGVLSLDGSPLLNPDGSQIISGPVDSFSGPFRP